MKINRRKFFGGILILGIILTGFFPADVILNKYDFKDCVIGVYDYKDTDILAVLSENQRDEFLNILDDINLYGWGSSIYSHFGGSYKEYIIYLKSGEKLEISSVGPYLVINGKGYLSNYKSLDGLSSFSLEVYMQYYSTPDN